MGYLTKASRTCCSKGQRDTYFTPSCLPPAVKQHVVDNLGCARGKFNFGKEYPASPDHTYTCTDGLYRCAEVAEDKGTSRTPGGQQCHERECKASKEGCHAKRGKDGFGEDLEFSPYTFIEAAQNLGHVGYGLSFCCDGELQLEKCKPHPDVPVLKTDMCKGDTFQP